MPSYDQFLLFGDSITQQAGNQADGFGFSTELQVDYQRKLDVINRGLSGYNTEMALKVLPRVIPTPDEATLRFMTIFFGANDACLESVGNGQHVPLEDFRTNLIKICKSPYVQSQNTRIIIVTTPPVDENMMNDIGQRLGIELTRTAEQTKQYADASREVGKSLGVAILDLWTAFATRAGWSEGQPLPGKLDTEPCEAFKELLSDGLHLRPGGYRVMYDELKALIRRTWPEQMPDNLPMVFPAWGDDSQWQEWTQTLNN